MTGIESHDVVTGALIENGKVLLCLRLKNRTWSPGVWDFPGGHVDLGESPEAALRRELREELDVDIPKPAGPPDYRLVESGVDLKLWIVHRWNGTPRNAAPDEHASIGWFSYSEACGLELAHVNYCDLIRSFFNTRS